MEMQCPSCQQSLSQVDFCGSCFVSLRPTTPGRFRGLLQDRLVQPEPERPVACTGPDLREISFEPSDWKTRVLIPMARQMARVGLVLGLLGAGAVAYEAYARLNAGEAAQKHWAELKTLAESKDWPGAERLGLAALERAGRAHRNDLIAHSHVLLAEVAVASQKWDSAVNHYQRAFDLEQDAPVREALEKTRARAQLEHCKEARKLLAEARAALAAKDYIKASGCASKACTLFTNNHGSTKETCQAFLLSARALERLGLLAESRGELENAAKLDPKEAEVKALLAQIEERQKREQAALPKPAPPRRSRRSATYYDPYASQVKFNPVLYQAPRYPTYQPPQPVYQPPVYQPHVYQPPVYHPRVYQPQAYQRPSVNVPQLPQPNYPTVPTAPSYPSGYSPPRR